MNEIMIKKKRKKGFTLVELLAVIVILAIILALAVPSVANVINQSKDRAFYASVSNLVDSIKPENVLEDKDYCMYNYSENDSDKNETIKQMFVIAHMESGRIVYSVYARSKENKIIDVYDFNKTDMTKQQTWGSADFDDSAYAFALKLKSTNFDDNEYKSCGVK